MSVVQIKYVPTLFAIVYFYVFSGQEEYNCVWLQPRGQNILEFQLGLYGDQSPSLNHCENHHFLQRTWLTQVGHFSNKQKGFFNYEI